MKKAVYLRIVAVIGAAVLLCGLLSALIFGVHEENQTRDWMVKLCHSASLLYDPSLTPQEQTPLLAQASGGDRVTIIAADGRVLADSQADADSMENHLAREELQDVSEDKVNIHLRTSSTLNEKLMYAAIRLSDGNILRIAHRYGGVMESVLRQIPSVSCAMLAALLLSALIATSFANSVTLPLRKVADTLSEGKLDALQGHLTRYEEVDRILVNIRALLTQISESGRALTAERKKIDYILSSMEEGFVLLDEEQRILLINQSAKNLFSCNQDVVSENILTLTRDVKIQKAVKNALQEGRSTLFDLENTDGQIYSVHVSSVPDVQADDAPSAGAALLFVNVTAERQAQTLRQEFFSNASHELKTPITSIRGFTELLNAGIVQDESKRQELFDRMNTETQRMTDLINDILMISRLEAGKSDEPRVPVNLADVAHEVIASLSPQAQQAQVTIHLQAQPVSLPASKRQMHEMLVNLVENAVKYNRPGGSVTVTIQDTSPIRITVADTGIGIPAECQPRLFERFYRVDSGRSKKVGGTGLGLSIVKHIVGSYGGEITLTSRENIGTTITIKLPRASREPS